MVRGEKAKKNVTGGIGTISKMSEEEVRECEERKTRAGARCNEERSEELIRTRALGNTSYNGDKRCVSSSDATYEIAVLTS